MTTGRGTPVGHERVVVASRAPGSGRIPVDRTDLDLLAALAGSGVVGTVGGAVNLTESMSLRRLARLESWLGVALRTGPPGRARLTAAGHVMLGAGQCLFAALTDAVHQIVGEGTVPAGPASCGAEHLRLAAFGRMWDGLADDLATHLPGILLDLRSAEPDETVGLFERRAVDAVYHWQVPGENIRPTRPAKVSGVLDEPMFVALPAGHRHAAEPLVSLASLTADEWIVAVTAQSRRLLHACCAHAGFTPRIGPVAHSAASARSLISAGRGVALVSPVATPPAPEAGVVIRPLADAPRRWHVLITDPTINDRVRRTLRSCLRSSYLARAGRDNPRYSRSGWFPVAASTVVDDGPSEPGGDPMALRETGTLGTAENLGGTEVPGPGVELEDLYALRVVARCGSLNRAAPVLMISQPALSRRIQRLEARLGVPLLVRSYRGTRPSPATHQLLALMVEAETAFHRALDAVRLRADGAA